KIGAVPPGLAQAAFEGAMEVREVRLRACEDGAVEAEPRCDGERVRCAREADVYAVRWPKRFGVELDARVRHAGRVECERLQLGVMRRRRDEDPALEERFE